MIGGKGSSFQNERSSLSLGVVPLRSHPNIIDSLLSRRRGLEEFSESESYECRDQIPGCILRKTFH